MVTAKVIKMGDSQVIRLPKDFRVSSTDVYLRKTSEGFLVIAKDPWKLFREGIEELSDGFMAGGRNQPDTQKRNAFPGTCS